VRFHHHDILGARLSPRGSIVASFDVVLCRNVLIYLEPRSQALAFDRFAEVVLPGGALVLGHAEALPATCRRFEAFPGVAPPLRVFVRTPLSTVPAEGAP
jgi:chemotaxis methyl-accepting protein methylase